MTESAASEDLASHADLLATADALRASEIQYRSLFEAANDALIIFEPEEERILEANARACELYGFERDEFIGRSLRSLTEDVERGREAIGDILRNGGIRNFESRHFHHDGRVLSLQISCSRITFGGDVAILTIVRDVSEQKETERLLRAAKDAAEEAARLKSDFLARMSHEIRTPMNGVIGMAELLLDSPLSPTQREYAESIYQSGETLLNLINDLLDFSKIEAGKLELENKSFDLHRLVGEIVELFAPRVDSRRVRLAHYVEPEIPPALVGDAHRLRQILTNLVSNAVKFTSDGQVIVRAELLRDETEQVLIRLSVRDSGIGIPASKQAKLFGAFTQADSTTARKYGGTGLGLAISKQLIEMMGGTIEIQSKLGSGSIFSIELPVRVDVETGHHSPHDSALAGIRALVVDDNPDSREITEKYLRSWGMTVGSTNSGEAAVAMIRSDPFDVVLAERYLSDFDGIVLASSIRVAAPATRVLLLTGFKQRTVTEAARRAGVDAFVPRPLWPHRLRSFLAGMLELNESESAVLHGNAPHSSAGTSASDGSDRPGILLVEDNRVNQRVAEAMLVKLGYHVEVAANGREALARLSNRRFDAILMDCQMPLMDGFETTRRIRELSGTVSETPIIALTANALQGDRERCINAGMNDYVTKPFRPNLLKEVLDRWITAAAESCA